MHAPTKVIGTRGCSARVVDVFAAGAPSLDPKAKSLYMFKCPTNKWNQDLRQQGTECGLKFHWKSSRSLRRDWTIPRDSHLTPTAISGPAVNLAKSIRSNEKVKFEP